VVGEAVEKAEAVAICDHLSEIKSSAAARCCHACPVKMERPFYI